MALTNAERQKKWRQKNRVIYNLRRRNARKNFPVTKGESSGAIAGVAPNSGAPLSKIEELRQLIANPVPAEPAKQSIYKDDYGRIINEHQWNTLQKLKAKARNGGYVLDDYTQ